MSADSPSASIVPLGRDDSAVVRGIESSEKNRRLTDALLAAELCHEHAFHFGVRPPAGGPPVAFVLCRLVLDELHIHHLRTLPDFRRQGFAIALVMHALARARLKGAKKALLEVRASNRAAVKLYEKAGFSRDSVRKKYYPDGDDAILMSKAL